MQVQSGNTVAFRADNGRYLSRYNHSSGSDLIAAVKSTVDQYCVFEYKFEFTKPDTSNNRKRTGRIALKSDNGSFWITEPSGDANRIRSTGKSEVYFEFILA